MMKELKDMLVDVDKKGDITTPENDKINPLRDALIKKRKQQISDKIFHDTLLEELRKVVDSYEVT